MSACMRDGAYEVQRAGATDEEVLAYRLARLSFPIPQSASAF
jgi:hypothetical protein